MNLFYKFKISGMSEYEVGQEILRRARSDAAGDFKKLKYIAKAGRLESCFEAVAQRLVTADQEAALHRLLQLPQVSDAQRIWCLEFAASLSDPGQRAGMMEAVLMHKPPCTQAQKDAWLADFLITGGERGAQMLVKYGASLEQALAVAEKIIVSQKDKLEKEVETRKKELSELCEKVVVSCKKIADEGQKPQP